MTNETQVLLWFSLKERDTSPHRLSRSLLQLLDKVLGAMTAIHILGESTDKIQEIGAKFGGTLEIPAFRL